MRCRRKLAIAVLAGLVLAGAAPAQTTLRYRFRAGEKLDYVIDVDHKATLNLRKTIDARIRVLLDMTWQTQKVDAQGGARVKVTFTRARMTMSSPKGKAEVDSSAAAEPKDELGQSCARFVKALAALDVTFALDPTGGLTDLKVSDAALKKLKDTPAAEQFGDMLSPQSFKAMVQGNLLLPKQAVVQGDRWAQPVDQQTPLGHVTGTVGYTYAGEVDLDGRKLAEIAIRPEPKIAPAAGGKLAAKVKSAGGKGMALFDNAAGRLAAATNETTLRLEVGVGEHPVEMVLVQTTTLRLKR